MDFSIQMKQSFWEMPPLWSEKYYLYTWIWPSTYDERDGRPTTCKITDHFLGIIHFSSASYVLTEVVGRRNPGKEEMKGSVSSREALASAFLSLQ